MLKSNRNIVSNLNKYISTCNSFCSLHTNSNVHANIPDLSFDVTKSSYKYHIPVLLNECMQYLDVQPGKLYVDCTLGGGGHTEKILQLGGKVIGIDRDMDAIASSSILLHKYIQNKQLSIVHGPFSCIQDIVMNNPLYLEQQKYYENILNRKVIGCVDGILADLGVSSYQINTKERGFSYKWDGPLDMRMYNSNTTSLDSTDVGRGTTITADEIVNKYSVDQLADILFTYGNEQRSRQIAREIVNARPILSTKHLKSVICSIIPARNEVKTLSKCFQAIRIVVNDEVQELERLLRQCSTLVKPRNLMRQSSGLHTMPSEDNDGNNDIAENRGGRLLMLSYHSLEDRIIKHWLNNKNNEISNNERNDSSLNSNSNSEIADLEKSTPEVVTDSYKQKLIEKLKRKKNNKLEKNIGTVKEATPTTANTMASSKRIMNSKNMSTKPNKYQNMLWKCINHKELITPSPLETQLNNRSRSAKLRIIEYYGM